MGAPAVFPGTVFIGRLAPAGGPRCGCDVKCRLARDHAPVCPGTVFIGRLASMDGPFCGCEGKWRMVPLMVAHACSFGCGHVVLDLRTSFSLCLGLLRLQVSPFVLFSWSQPSLVWSFGSRCRFLATRWLVDVSRRSFQRVNPAAFSSGCFLFIAVSWPAEGVRGTALETCICSFWMLSTTRCFYLLRGTELMNLVLVVSCPICCWTCCRSLDDTSSSLRAYLWCHVACPWRSSSSLP